MCKAVLCNQSLSFQNNPNNKLDPFFETGPDFFGCVMCCFCGQSCKKK